MQDSKIEQRIEDIYTFVESCKMKSFSSTLVIVPKNDLYDLLDDLRRDLPNEIKRYRKILAQKEAIMEDARKKAAEITQDAREQYNASVEEHSITQAAYQQADAMIREATAQAESIVSKAKQQADEIGNGALYYTSDLLNAAEKIIAQAYNSTVNNSKALETALRGHLEIIAKNKAELGPMPESREAAARKKMTAAKEPPRKVERDTNADAAAAEPKK